MLQAPSCLRMHLRRAFLQRRKMTARLRSEASRERGAERMLWKQNRQHRAVTHQARCYKSTRRRRREHYLSMTTA